MIKRRMGFNEKVLRAEEAKKEKALRKKELITAIGVLSIFGGVMTWVLWLYINWVNGGI